MMGAILFSLFVPRGRACRSEFVVAAAAMILVEVVLLFFGPQIQDNAGVAGTGFLKAIAIWVGCTLTIRRLHDLGMSAWWLLGGAGLLCMWMALILLSGLFILGRDVLVQGSFLHLSMAALAMMPAFGIALWLHLAPGEPFRNRFGAPKTGIHTASSGDERPFAQQSF